MLLQKISDTCWAACGAGSNILVRDVEESEKMQNSHMSGFPSIVSCTSMEACASAIISALWLDALMAIGTLC